MAILLDVGVECDLSIRFELRTHFLELRVHERVGGLAVGGLVDALLQNDLLGFQDRDHLANLASPRVRQLKFMAAEEENGQDMRQCSSRIQMSKKT